MVKDPVCGMTVDKNTTAATASYQGQTYYFRSAGCKATFERHRCSTGSADGETRLCAGTSGRSTLFTRTHERRPMKTILTILLTVALGTFAIAHAQQAPPPGASPMGPGMMVGMHQQMMGLMQQMGGMMQQMGEMMASGQMSPERMKQMGDAMKQMGSLMGGMGARGGSMGPMAMPEMSKMMEHMAEMQKRMSDMMGMPK